MKLRILGDTLRLRLAQSEVRALIDLGEVRDSIHFITGELSYVASLDASAEGVTAELEGTMIRVRIPASLGRAWANGDEVGLRGEQWLGADRTLRVLVEKDFKCLAPREGEEAYDAFPNPDAGQRTCP